MTKIPPRNQTTPESAGQPEPIAIIGIGCRYPGGIHDLESFWHVVKNGIDAISEIPPDRFDQDTFYDPIPATPGKVVTAQGGFLSDRLDYFDAAFFGISPREAAMMDPQQRLLLETAWEAIEDGGISRAQITGSRTGVYIGMWTNEYQDRLFQGSKDIDLYSTTGSGRYAASGRLSFVFDLQGPSLTIDTACSSSLVATHLACQSLRKGETEMALVGAANLILEPDISIGYSRSKMLSPDARCKFGDASANGYVRSEGVGILVLKPLSRALADGNPIHAVILGSATNNDGHGSGLLVAPSGQGQATMLRAAYRDANILPGQVDYVEAHGTGTSAGDPVELQALSEVLGEGRAPGNPCAVGSVKTNFGHTEAASGLAGLIKTIACLKNRAIPPNLHFITPNPRIAWDAMPIYLPTELRAWPERDRQLLAGVNSFGITGTNAHILLQEAPQVTASPSATRFTTLPLSARSPEALKAMAHQYAETLAHSAIDLADILYTVSRHRFHHDHRLAVSGDSRSALSDALKAFAAGDPLAPVTTGQAEGKPKVVFVFPGQGSQWAGMGRQLFKSEPAFQESIQRCEEAFRPFVDWSLVEQLTAPENQTRMTEINVIQPALFAIEVALAETWRAWGIEPDAVVGHSMGEPAAAYIAGALSLEDAARVICTRSRLMKTVSGKGGMAVVDLTPDEANAALAGFESLLSVAVVNGPHTSVLSGDLPALEKVIAALEARGVFVRLVKVDVAAHSPHMDALRPLLIQQLAGIQPQVPSIPIYSTVTGKLVDFALDAEYWGQNLRHPVIFSTTVDQMTADGTSAFVECSPHPILLTAIEQNNPGETSSGVRLFIPSMRRGEEELRTLRQGLEKYYCAGGEILWDRLYPVGQCVRLPAYPWQRERFWPKEAELGAQASARHSERFLTTFFETPHQAGVKSWQATISLALYPYVADHRVGEAVLLPAAAFIEMLFETALSLNSSISIEAFELHQALSLQADSRYTVQISVFPDQSFIISSHPENDPAWVEHGRGFLRNSPDARALIEFSLDELEGSDEQPGSEHVAAMLSRGLEYGASFQAITNFRRRGEVIFAQIRLPAGLVVGDQFIHPSMLDACFQLLIGTLDREHARGDAFLPVKIARCCLRERPRGNAPLRVFVRRTSPDAGDSLSGNIRVQDEQGHEILAIDGLEMSRLKGKAHPLDDLLYSLEWDLDSDLPQVHSAGGHWLIAGRGSPVTLLAEQMQALHATTSFYQRNHRQDSPANPIEVHEPLHGVIYLAAQPGHDPAASAFSHVQELLDLVQALGQREWIKPPRLWIVTLGAVSAAVGDTTYPQLTAVWGMAATIAHEFPEWRTTRVDLDSLETLPLLIRELVAGDRDPIALRGAQRFSAHLVHQKSQPDDPSAAAQTSPAGDRPFRVEIPRRGVLDSLELRACSSAEPAPGQVTIDVTASGMNFIDVMKAMGIYPGADPLAPVQFGLECAGTISAIGHPSNGSTTKFSVGQEVLAFAPHSFSKKVAADAHLVVPKPAHLSFHQAAALPVVYLTAYYALIHLGRMRPGERVLIHSAAGGVGLAAIQLANHVGAEIYATAGSDEKRAYLHSLGIHHVMDSRSLDFAGQIMALTQGRGVDLVLNSLTGEAISKSLSILAPYGRFLEIGKRDIYQNASIGLLPFQKNLSYFAIDLDRIARERPEFLGEMFIEVMALLEQGKISPLPISVYPIVEIAEAMRRMSQPNHIGKIVLSMSDPSVAVLPSLQETAAIKADATYLITGGLGGLGLAIAGRLVEKGARHLALVNRGGEDRLTAEARTTLDMLRGEGADLTILAADIADLDQAKSVLAHIRDHHPTLRGIIHAAGVLDDGALMQMTSERLQKVFAPKVTGAWNLHTLTQDQPLDFFVLFSSVTATFGSPGQGNYAAANAFLDGLAYSRQATGLPALSINWGPWSQIGLAAHRSQGGLQGLGGLIPISPEQGLDLFMRALAISTPQVIATGIHASDWIQSHPAASRSTLFADFAASSPGAEHVSANPVRANLLAAPSGRPRQTILEAYVKDQVALVLRLPPSRVDVHKPLRTLGLDSLMSIELRNRLESGLEVALSATLVWNYPSINDLVPHLAEKMGIPLDGDAASAPQAAPPGTTAQRPADSADLNNLTDEELAAMLDNELDEIDNLL